MDPIIETGLACVVPPLIVLLGSLAIVAVMMLIDSKVTKN